MRGIYKITCISNNKIYIGSSVDIKSRWNRHKSYLRRNKHDNPHLQHSWNLYGESNFIFDIVEECDKLNNDKLLSIKQKWINNSGCLNNKIGFNIAKIAGPSMMGRKHTEEAKKKMSLSKIGKVVSEETKKKISLSKLGKPGWNKGKIMPEQQKKKLSEAHMGKIAWNRGKKFINGTYI